MEALAKELLRKIDDICFAYHVFKKSDTIEEGKKISAEMQRFLEMLMQSIAVEGNVSEKEELQRYIALMLQDYIEAVRQRDAVLMIDTLDFGLRELLKMMNPVSKGDADE